MIDLLGKKIWIGNDRELLERVEKIAFSQGWRYCRFRKYLGAGVYKTQLLEQSSNLKKVDALYFLLSRDENKKCIVENLTSDNHKNLSKHHTRKDRFNGRTRWNDVYYYQHVKFTEITASDLFKTIEVW